MTIKEYEQIPIPVVEIFQSISGEGISAGNIVSFVRIAGCNLRCAWCDTKYSFNESGEGVQMMLPADIRKTLSGIGSNEIICTGGEPLEEGKSKRFLPVYLANFFKVRVETSGGSILYSEKELLNFGILRDQISYCMDIKCPGSKMDHKNLYNNIFELKKNDELKFVVINTEDLLFSLEIIEKYKSSLSGSGIALNFSPVFGSVDPDVIVDFLKENTKYFMDNSLWARLSLQLHKIVWPPDMRGV